MPQPLATIHPDNYRLYVKEPKDFSADRNKQVIKQVIDENEKMQRELNSEVRENAGQVAEILSHFGKYKLDQGGEKKIERYLGKSWMTKIYGEKLIEKIRRKEEIEKQNIQNGNTKFKEYYLT